MHRRIAEHKLRTTVIVGVFTLLLLISGGVLLAQVGFSIPRWTADGGGGLSMGDAYTSAGAMGQPDAGVALEGGNYALSGGLWHGAEGGAQPDRRLYLPIVRRP